MASLIRERHGPPLTCPKTKRVIRIVDGGEIHCNLNKPSLKHQIEFDWLDEVFK